MLGFRRPASGHQAIVTARPVIVRPFDAKPRESLSDLRFMQALEELAFDSPLCYAELADIALDRDGLCKIAEINQRPVGHLLATVLDRHYVRVWSIAVHPHYRRAGVGRALLEAMLPTLPGSTRKVSLVCRETNLPAQLFLRACGFVAVEIMRDYYDPPHEQEQGYLFERSV